jgi:radical SAM-linked protein
MIRIRLTYKKGSSLRYTGHLDLHKVWERTFRRARLPLAYSQGFHPQPKIQQACPLPLGFTSDCELVDFWLTEDVPTNVISTTLEPALHPGITILDLESIPLSDPPLQTTIRSARYEILLLQSENPDSIIDKINSVLSAENLQRERRGKVYNLRPLIHSLAMNDETASTMVMQLSAMPGATGRPEEVLSEMGMDPVNVEVTRTALYFEINDD